MLLTLDSSVIVAALRNQEAFHDECLQILEQVSAGQHVAVQPLTVLVEVVAAIRRRTGSQGLAAQVERALQGLTSLHFVELDMSRARRASRIAQHSGMRGMDAIVVAAAQEVGSVLVSLDLEMFHRADDLVQTLAVTDF